MKFGKYISVMFCAAALAGLSGCYDYKPVPVEIDSETYTGSKKVMKRIIPEDCEVLTLDMAEDLSLGNNPSFIAKHHAMVAAWARFYQSLSGYFPTVTSSYTLGDTNTNPGYQKNQWNNKTDAFSQQMSFQGQYLIFDGLVREMTMLAAKRSAKQSEYDEEDAKRLLIKSVANRFNEVLLQIENMRISKSDMEFQQKMLDETQLKYEAGAVPLSDVLNFKVKVNTAESNLITNQYNYNTATYTLATLMGITEAALPPGIKFPSMSADVDDHISDVSVFIDTALANRPDLKSYREAVGAAEYTMYSRWGAFSPTVNANTGWNYSRTKTQNDMRYGQTYQGADSYDTIGNATAVNYGGTVSWTLFDGTYRIMRVREAQAQLAQSQYTLAAKWIEVVQDVRSAFDNLQTSRKQAVLYKKTLVYVTKQRDLVEEEYKAGNTELTRLNEAQNELVKAETNFVSALINVHNAKAQLDAAINAR